MTSRAAETLAGWLRPHWVRSRLSSALADVETYGPPQAVSKLPGERPLVIAPHPDDETLGCGGAIATWTTAGVQPDIVFLTDGAAGDPAL
jgi:hypothetical protein